MPIAQRLPANCSLAFLFERNLNLKDFARIYKLSLTTLLFRNPQPKLGALKVQKPHEDGDGIPDVPRAHEAQYNLLLRM